MCSNRLHGRATCPSDIARLMSIQDGGDIWYVGYAATNAQSGQLECDELRIDNILAIPSPVSSGVTGDSCQQVIFRR